MSITNIALDIPLLSAGAFARVMPTNTQGPRISIRRVADFIKGLAGGARAGVVELRVGAVKATATLTVTSTGPTNTETFVVAGTTFTAVTSGATGNQFNISATPATVAANIVAAVNGSATAAVTGAVVASAVSGVVTFTAKIAGTIGNGLVLTESLTNVALAGFSGGSDGTLQTFNLG